MRRSHVGCLIFVLGCRPEPPTRTPGKEDTGGGSAEVHDSDTAAVDTDTGAPPDTEVPDTDSAVPVDSDSGGGTVDTDTDVVVPVVEDLESVAMAKLVGEEALSTGGCTNICMAAALFGDVNGDGLDDVVIGLNSTDRGGTNAGAAYVVFGPVAGTLPLSTADGALLGDVPGGEPEHAGTAVALVGDINGDGLDDVLVGAPDFAGEGTGYMEGQAYLVLGPADGERSLTDADATFHGMPVVGSDGNTGASVAGAGDVDGDGFDDVLIAAPGYSEAYLLNGPLSGRFELESDSDAVLDGAYTGVAGVGDINGDGLDDVVVGGAAGDTCVYEGPIVGELSATDADVTLVNSSAHASAEAPQSAGDVNADGYPDLLLDGGTDDEAGRSSGAAYLFTSPFSSTIDVTEAAAKMVGEQQWDHASAHGGLARAGDLDGDSYGDVVVAAPNTGWVREGTYEGHGTVYVFFGPLSGTISVGDAPVQLEGAGDDRVGAPLAGGGDVDGDGIPDFLVGGPGDDDGGEDAGAAWVVSGVSVL